MTDETNLRHLAEETVAGLWCVVYAETEGATVLAYDSPGATRCPWVARVVRSPGGVRTVSEIGATPVRGAILRWAGKLSW